MRNGFQKKRRREEEEDMRIHLVEYSILFHTRPEDPIYT
jgi:hypothetical protein